MRITANQVTFARLILMPGICLMLYGGETARLWAVILGTIIGCTDFVDGYLARKQGPTVLGGLMDPIADKVFIAVSFMPFADLGYVAWWLLAILFLREFLVTALRSSFELRQRQLKSTYLAKVKTWFQMVGIGLVLLLMVVHSKVVIASLFGALTVLPLVGWVIFKQKRGRSWTGALVGSAGFAGVQSVYLIGGAHGLSVTIIWVMIGITWLSAVDYVVLGAKEVLRHLHAFDFTRLAGAAALPVLALLSVVRTDADAWPIIMLLAVEFAHGGLDNLLAHHGVAASALSWGARLFAVNGLLAAGLLLPEQARVLAFIAAGVSAVLTAVTFYRQRRFYLEEKLREKKRSPAPQTA